MNFFQSFVDKGLKERLEHVASSDFGRVTYTEAVELLKRSGHKFDYPVDWGCDLQTEHELSLIHILSAGISRVTTEPEAITARSPMVTPGLTMTPAPSQTWSPMVMGRAYSWLLYTSRCV